MVIQDDGRKTRLRREVFRSALGIEQTPFSRIKEAFLAVLIFAAFLAFVDTVRDNYTFSGADLRNRVVGARALLQGLDPYFYEWKQDMSDRLLDPRNSYVDVLLMLPVALLLPRLLRTKRRPFSFAIVLCGLLCGLLFMYIKGTLLRNVLVTLTLDIVVIREVLREAAEARQV